MEIALILASTSNTTTILKYLALCEHIMLTFFSAAPNVSGASKAKHSASVADCHNEIAGGKTISYYFIEQATQKQPKPLSYLWMHKVSELVPE